MSLVVEPETKKVFNLSVQFWPTESRKWKMICILDIQSQNYTSIVGPFSKRLLSAKTFPNMTNTTYFWINSHPLYWPIKKNLLVSQEMSFFIYFPSILLMQHFPGDNFLSQIRRYHTFPLPVCAKSFFSAWLLNG